MREEVKSSGVPFNTSACQSGTTSPMSQMSLTISNSPVPTVHQMTFAVTHFRPSISTTDLTHPVQHHWPDGYVFCTAYDIGVAVW